MKYFDGVHQEPCTKDIYASRHYIMTSSGVDVDERILLTQLNQRDTLSDWELQQGL